jgi:Ca2+/Na+ antiporter
MYLVNNIFHLKVYLIISNIFFTVHDIFFLFLSSENNLSANGNGSTFQDVVDIGEPVELNDDETPRYPWQRPAGEGILGHIWWGLYLPLTLVFFITIPDVRYPKLAKFYPLSFFMCMAWIGAVAYVVTWMITIIGYTFGIPDSVMGLSFLAVGTSIPEVFSSLIVSRQGKGSMAISNSIGSNTFDILVIN